MKAEAGCYFFVVNSTVAIVSNIEITWQHGSLVPTTVTSVTLDLVTGPCKLYIPQRSLYSGSKNPQQKHVYAEGS